MLIRVLEMIGSGERRSDAICRKMGISSIRLREIEEDLVRMGYLEEIGKDSEDCGYASCRGCPVSGDCQRTGSAQSIRMLRISKKGMRFLSARK
jgi:hypothetical protein